MRLSDRTVDVLAGIVTVVLMLAFVLLTWLTTACSHATKPTSVIVTNPLLVKIEPPDIEKPSSCYLESMPTEPEEVKMYMEDDDVIRRDFVHVRQWNEMVTFAHDMTMWGASIAECINDLTKDMK